MPGTLSLRHRGILVHERGSGEHYLSLFQNSNVTQIKTNKLCWYKLILFWLSNYLLVFKYNIHNVNLQETIHNDSLYMPYRSVQ